MELHCPMRTCVPRWTRSCLRATTRQPAASLGSCTAWQYTLSTSNGAGRRSRASWGTGTQSSGKVAPFPLLVTLFLSLPFLSEQCLQGSKGGVPKVAACPGTSQDGADPSAKSATLEGTFCMPYKSWAASTALCSLLFSHHRTS